MPARHLYGIVPAVLLEGHTFWQDESDDIRGYANAADADDVLLIRLGQGAHVSFFGSRFERVRLADYALAPTRAIVLRLKAQRMRAQRADIVAAIEVRSGVS